MSNSSSSRWIPLESNPEVMTNWAQKAGLDISKFRFDDIYGLDEELLAMVPQPVKAVLLLFPIGTAYEEKRKEEDRSISDLPIVDPSIIFIKQTIGNACGTMGLLHSLMNTDVSIVPDTPLSKFKELCKDKTPQDRATLLETTPLFGTIHEETARSGQSSVPTNLDTNLHFTCFVKVPVSDGFRLVELDGRRVGPVDRGPCTDLLRDATSFVRQEYIKGTDSIQFGLNALTAA